MRDPHLLAGVRPRRRQAGATGSSPSGPTAPPLAQPAPARLDAARRGRSPSSSTSSPASRRCTRHGLFHGQVGPETVVIDGDGRARLAELALCAAAAPPGFGAADRRARRRTPRPAPAAQGRVALRPGAPPARAQPRGRRRGDAGRPARGAGRRRRPPCSGRAGGTAPGRAHARRADRRRPVAVAAGRRRAALVAAAVAAGVVAPGRRGARLGVDRAAGGRAMTPPWW